MSNNAWAYVLFVAIAFPCGFLAMVHWQRAIFGVFILLIFEGALRKWVVPGAQAQIYFVKDAILLAAYVGFVADGKKTGGRITAAASISIILLVFFVFGCIELLNPSSPSILVGLMGLKVYFLYAPLAFVLPYAFKSQDHLLRSLWVYLLIAIPVAVLGFVQIAAGPGSFLNTYVSQTEDAAAGVAFGRDYDLIRTSGTFSYISGYTAYLSFIAFLATGFNMAQHWRIKNNIIPLAALTVTIGAMFTTGSRAPVYTLIAMAPVILVWAAASGVMSSGIALRLGLLLPIVALVALNLSPEAFQAFTERASESNDSTSDRLFSTVYQIIGALGAVPVLGLGIGVTHPSAMTIMGAATADWLGDTLVEVEVARITMELGFIGLVLMLLLRIAVVVVAFQCTRAFKNPAYRALGICLTVHLALSVTGTIILNNTAGLYYWGALGLVLAMQRFDRVEKLAAAKKKPKARVLQVVN
jgi:hypothetical protein